MKFKNQNILTTLLIIGFIFSLVIGVFTRFVGLTQFPPSLYWEEAALGYDAYSILKTGHDVHGNYLPLVAFESFGDYKPSFYFYTLVPSIAIFGLTDFAVRFPSALSGVFLIIAVGLLGRELGFSLVSKNKKNSILPQTMQVIAMLITSLSPWAIQFSRGAWEVNLATTLLTWGLLLQLMFRRNILESKVKLIPQNILKLAFSILLIALSMYTYHATRLVAPVLLLGLWSEIAVELWLATGARSQNFASFFQKKLSLFVGAGTFFIIMISPILLSLNKVETQQRFAETSLFADGRQVKLSNQLISGSKPQWLGKILYHRYVISADMILQNYLSHFSFKFLFLNGDANPRHSTQFVGLMYTGEVILLLAGLFFLISRRNVFIFFIFFWLFVGVVPAAITTATPHALRILPCIAIWMLILTAGAFQIGIWLFLVMQTIWVWLKKQENDYATLSLVLSLFVIFYGWQFFSYWRFYSIIYPKVYAGQWQYGYHNMISDLQKVQEKYPTLPVQITREYGRPSMYYWFYTQTNPVEVQAEEATAKKDQGEFLQFKTVSFVDHVYIKKKTIAVSSEEEYLTVQTKVNHTELLEKITDPLKKTIWVIYLAE